MESAITLADSFLNDLDELENEDVQDDEEKEEEEPRTEARQEAMMDLEEEKPTTSGLLKDLDSVRRLRKSRAYVKHMAAVTEKEDEDSYNIIVASNEVLVQIEEEIAVVFAYLRDIYALKYPELETLIPQKMDYARVVKEMRNEMDMTQIDLGEVLPPTQVMVVSVTGSTTTGKPLSEEQLKAALEACDEMLALDSDKFKILEFLESRMSRLAPNISKLVGASLAAMVVGMAGGLDKLAHVPACNLIALGQDKRKDLAGFGRVAQMPHTGILYFADLVQAAPGPLRKKVLKMLAAKVSLAARVDAYRRGSDEAQDVATGFLDDIKSKIEKLCEPQQAQQVKALPAPDIAVGKRKRGGRRVRNLKEKTRVTDLRNLANKRAFANDVGNEYGDDAMGLDFGLLGKDGANVRAAAINDVPGKTKKRTPPQGTLLGGNSKQRKPVQLSSGATGGISSSLVFTPVQGIELANPTAMAQKVQAANEKWFSESSGFQSALNARPPSSSLTF